MDIQQIVKLRTVVQQFIKSFGLLEQTKTPCGFTMSMSQVFALQELQQQTMTLTELAKKLMLDRSSVSRLIDALVKGDFVQRKVNENNRREVILGLTNKGLNTVNRVREQSVSFYREILQEMSESDQNMFYQGMSRFTELLFNTRRN